MACNTCMWQGHPEKCKGCYYTAPELYEVRKEAKKLRKCGNCVHDEETTEGEHCKVCKHNCKDFSKERKE